MPARPPAAPPASGPPPGPGFGPATETTDGGDARARLDAVYTRGLDLWEQAERVASLLAIDPHGLGGVCLTGGTDGQQAAWLAGLAGLMPAAAQVQLPGHATEEVLVGGTSLDRSLASGTVIEAPGLLARADGGVLIVRRADGMDGARAALIAGALDTREVAVERTGRSRKDAADFALVLLDAHEPGEPLPPAALLDRVAFALPLGAVPARCLSAFSTCRADIDAARSALGRVRVPDGVHEAIVETASATGIASLRAPLLVLRAARALAALDGEPAVSEEALREASALVLGHRVTLQPDMAAPESDPPPEPDPPQDPEPAQDPAADAAPPDTGPGTDAGSDSEPDPAIGALEDQLIEAVQSAAAAAALDGLTLSSPRLPGAAAKSGRAGADARRQANGRPDRPLPRQRMKSGRIDLMATLRTALPFQRLRGLRATRTGRVQLRPGDLQVKTYRHRTGTTVIFVVDASGSSALNRMGEAKGAIEHLLSDCYSRRDQVALIAVRGDAPDLLLPPSRALTRARRALAALPSGGTTPLAGGLQLAGDLASRQARAGQTPFIVLLSDGRGNVALDGSTDRDRAGADLDRAARQVATLGIPVLVFDTARRPGGRALGLARTLRADYRHLPFASAAAISGDVRARIGRP